jgi:hypothetical protein
LSPTQLESGGGSAPFAQSHRLLHPVLMIKLLHLKLDIVHQFTFLDNKNIHFGLSSVLCPLARPQTLHILIFSETTDPLEQIFVVMIYMRSYTQFPHLDFFVVDKYDFSYVVCYIKTKEKSVENP